MTTSRLRWSFAAAGAALAILGGAVWLGREALAYRWRFAELCADEPGSFSAFLGGGDPPGELALAADWFVARRTTLRPRLVTELAQTDPCRKAVALELLGRMDAADGREPDAALFWEAFEDRPAVAAFLDAPVAVLALARTPGVHGDGGFTVQWAQSDADSTRVWLATIGLSPQIRSVTLRGERRLRFLRGVARMATMRELPAPVAAAPGDQSVLRLDYHLARAGAGSRLERTRSFALSGWAWVDDAFAAALEAANRPDESESEPYDSEAAARFLAGVLTSGPRDASALARRVVDHPLLAATIGSRARELAGAAAESNPAQNETGGGAQQALPPVSR